MSVLAMATLWAEGAVERVVDKLQRNGFIPSDWAMGESEKKRLRHLICVIYEDIEHWYAASRKEDDERSFRILSGHIEDCSAEQLERASVLLAQAAIDSVKRRNS